MVLPQTNELLLPLLKVIENKEEYKVQEIIDEVVDTLELSEEDLNEKMPNNEPVISSRISTANMRLKKAELVELKRFGYYSITEKGKDFLSTNPDELTEEDLMKNPKFKEFKEIFEPAKPIKDDNRPIGISKMGPASMMEAAFLDEMERIQKDIEEDMKKGNDVKYFKPKDAEIPKAKSHAKTRHHHHNSKDNPKYVIQFSPADELLKFADLLERGYISREEFDRKKVIEILK